MPNRKVYQDLDQLSKAVCATIADMIDNANQKGRPFSIALSGGSTPKRLYQYLAQPPFVDKINWAGVKIFFGDERSVAPSDPQSNYLMAKEALFDQLPIPSENIYRIRGELADHKRAAKIYQHSLLDVLPRSEEGVPIFDLILLGIGTDGHIASLFPGTAVLAEQRDFVSAVYVPKLHAWRLTITYPVLNHAKSVFILASGAEKANIIHEVLCDISNNVIYPVQGIQPKGELTWFLDEAAAAKLPGKLP
jgi:6-phosphogluconolactonase